MLSHKVFIVVAFDLSIWYSVVLLIVSLMFVVFVLYAPFLFSPHVLGTRRPPLANAKAGFRLSRHDRESVEH